MASSHGLLADSTLFLFLLRIDRDLASADRGGGCRRCGGRLDVANYRRKPRGAPAGLPPEFALRFSNCCSAESCRRRSTPPSARFLGPKVYLGVIVCLVTAMRQGPTPSGQKKLTRFLGVDRRTLKRWQTWWKDAVPASRPWKAMRARFMPPIDEALLPGSLVERFHLVSIEGVGTLMHFLLPLSTSRALSG
jgi:hypothetical protein